MNGYLLDSNIYINFYDRYYRHNLFPSFWLSFSGIVNKNVVIPNIVVNEQYQDEWFVEWLQQNFQGSKLDHRQFAKEWGEVLLHIKNSNLYTDGALNSARGWANERIADPWLIAIAKRENLTIVTDENKNINLNPNSPSKAAKIPDICEDLGIRCIKMNEYFTEIGLRI